MESLEKHVAKLADILDKEHSLYKTVHELVKTEQSVLVNADIEKLEENLKKQQELNAKINKLEIKRLEELEVIGIYLGSLPEQLKVAVIAKHVDAELSGRLLKQEKLLKSVLQDILNLNKSNKFLITRSLQFIEKNVQVFFGAIEEKGLYNPQSSVAKAAPDAKRMVDWKA